MTTTTDLPEAEQLTPEQREQAERIAALLADRAAVEAASAKDLQKIAKTLTTSRTAAVDAVAAAQRALVDMVRALDGYNSTIDAAAADLIDRGLPLADEAGTHDVGGTPRNGVRVADAWWLPVSSTAMYARTTAAAATGAFGRRHPITSSNIPADFAALIPELPAPDGQPHQGWGVTVDGAPVGLREGDKERAKRDRAPKFTEFNPHIMRR